MLNGVYIEFANLDEAKVFDKKIFDYYKDRKPSLWGIGQNKIFYEGVAYREISPTVAIFRTGKGYYPTDPKDVAVDPFGNKLKRQD